MSQNIICIVTNENQAARITDKLKAHNFSGNDISVLFSDKSGTKDFAEEKSTKAPEGAAAGAGTGGGLGAAIGWLSGVGALSIPGLGPIIAAGPIMGLLSGAGAGIAVGGITGALVGMGIPEHEARQYEDKVKGGEIMISVQVNNSDKDNRVRNIFNEAGGQDIANTGGWSKSNEFNHDKPGVEATNRRAGEDQLHPQTHPGNKDSTISTTDPNDPEIPGKEEPRV